MFKRIGTLEYKTNPNSLTFHVQSGKIRHFSNQFSGYKEMDLIDKDWPYVSVLANPEATTYTSATNYLAATRVNGGTEYSVKYTKVVDSGEEQLIQETCMAHHQLQVPMFKLLTNIILP